MERAMRKGKGEGERRMIWSRGERKVRRKREREEERGERDLKRSQQLDVEGDGVVVMASCRNCTSCKILS